MSPETFSGRRAQAAGPGRAGDLGRALDGLGRAVVRWRILLHRPTSIEMALGVVESLGPEAPNMASAGVEPSGGDRETRASKRGAWAERLRTMLAALGLSSLCLVTADPSEVALAARMAEPRLLAPLIERAARLFGRPPAAHRAQSAPTTATEA